MSYVAVKDPVESARSLGVPPGELPKLLAGRLAGAFYVAGALVSALRLIAAPAHQYNQPGILAVSAVALVTGVVTLRAPWDRWPRRASLVLVPIAFTLIGIGNAFGTDPFSFGIFYVMAFVWMGVSHPRWTSIKFAPLAAVAYALPIMFGPFKGLGPSSTVITIPVCVVVGESLALLGARAKHFAEAFWEEQQVAKRLREVDEMKNTFLNAVSHELRTPLTSVLGFALTLEMNRGQLTTEEHDDLLRRLSRNAQKLDRLLSDLLDLDRMQRGVLLPTLHLVRLDLLVEEMTRSFDLGGRPVEVAAQPVEARVDVPKIERVVENLLGNAVKHSGPDVPIQVTVVPDRDGVLISVDDDGPGIPEDLRDRIFEPFERGSAVDGARPGTGIGLSLVRRFVELHGGRVWVADAPSGGASFRVYLPRTGPEEEPAAPSPGEPAHI